MRKLNARDIFASANMRRSGLSLLESRAEWLTARAPTGKSFPENVALLRTSEEMGEYFVQSILYDVSKKASRLHGLLPEWSLSSDDMEFYPEGYHLVGSFSDGFVQNGVGFNLGSFRFPRDRFYLNGAISLNNTRKLYYENVELLKKCRSTENRIYDSLQHVCRMKVLHHYRALDYRYRSENRTSWKYCPTTGSQFGEKFSG